MLPELVEKYHRILQGMVQSPEEHARCLWALGTVALPQGVVLCEDSVVHAHEVCGEGSVRLGAGLVKEKFLS